MNVAALTSFLLVDQAHVHSAPLTHAEQLCSAPHLLKRGAAHFFYSLVFKPKLHLIVTGHLGPSEAHKVPDAPPPPSDRLRHCQGDVIRRARCTTRKEIKSLDHHSQRSHAACGGREAPGDGTKDPTAINEPVLVCWDGDWQQLRVYVCSPLTVSHAVPVGHYRGGGGGHLTNTRFLFDTSRRSCSVGGKKGRTTVIVLHSRER